MHKRIMYINVYSPLMTVCNTAVNLCGSCSVS